MPKAKSILFEVYSLFYQFNWYSKLLGFKIIANCNDSPVGIFFSLPYMYMCVFVSIKINKKFVMAFFVMSCLLFDPHLSLYGHHCLYKKNQENNHRDI